MTVYKKKCICGCGGYIITRNKYIDRDYIVGHDRKILEGLGCDLCGHRFKVLILYKMANCNIDVCQECYTNIQKEKDERIKPDKKTSWSKEATVNPTCCLPEVRCGV